MEGWGAALWGGGDEGSVVLWEELRVDALRSVSVENPECQANSLNSVSKELRG